MVGESAPGSGCKATAPTEQKELRGLERIVGGGGQGSLGSPEMCMEGVSIKM